MAGKRNYLVERNGRYYARVVVPPRLRPILKKTELTAALGGDKRQASRRLNRVVAAFQDQIQQAEQQIAQTSRKEPPTLESFDAVAAALASYRYSVEFDGELRDATPLYARSGHPDENYVKDLKSIVAGRLEDHELPTMFLMNIRQHVPPRLALDRPRWRQATRLLAQAELAAIEVSIARNEGEQDPPLPDFLATANADAQASTTSRETVEQIFAGYCAELQRAGKGRNADRRWAPILKSLTDFLGHNSAARITHRDAVRWKDQLLESLSPKTVRDAYLATAKAAFTWAEDNLELSPNPFEKVKVRMERKVANRPPGFEQHEAEAILKAACSYSGSSKEADEMIAAKRWVPLLNAYSGARVTELCQLRVEDVRHEEGIPYLRLTPAAGTIKSGHYRDVPLHDHIVEEGFLEFVKGRGTGPLFYRPGSRRGRTTPAEIVATGLGKWIRSLGVIPSGIQPNHGWRHTFKTVATEQRADARVVDAIQGHAPRSAGETYGKVTLKAKHAVIRELPRYKVR